MGENKKGAQTKTIAMRLYRAAGKSIANHHYCHGIKVFENYKKNYRLTDNQFYQLGLLYDHLAMTIKNGKRKRSHIAKARAIYQQILKRNPDNHFALFGLGRTYFANGKMNKAIFYQTKAYKKMLLLPRNERGALGVGNLYETIGDHKNAERWYLRERHATSPLDFGTIANLFGFYQRRGDYKKALFYALKTERIMKNEYKKKIYTGIRMRQSEYFKNLKENIRRTKNKRRTSNK